MDTDRLEQLSPTGTAPQIPDTPDEVAALAAATPEPASVAPPEEQKTTGAGFQREVLFPLEFPIEVAVKSAGIRGISAEKYMVDSLVMTRPKFEAAEELFAGSNSETSAGGDAYARMLARCLRTERGDSLSRAEYKQLDAMDVVTMSVMFEKVGGQAFIQRLGEMEQSKAKTAPG